LAGFEPANLGTKGQHATPRPAKPVYESYLPKITILTYAQLSTLHHWGRIRAYLGRMGDDGLNKEEKKEASVLRLGTGPKSLSTDNTRQ